MDASATTGISTEDFLRYYNWAQERIFALILEKNPNSFQGEKIIDIVANQEAYTIPDNVYLGERIVNVEYSPTGDARDYYKIFEASISFRDTYPQNYAFNYIRRNGQILLRPMPSAGGDKLRVVYERMIDRLDTRRGTVTARTLSATQLTALTIDIATDDPTQISGVADKYLCVCNKDGVVQMYNIPYTSYDNTTGVFTLPAFTFQTGETVAVGDYITVGQYTTTHSALRNICEKYLAAYCNWTILGRDAATAAKAKYFESTLQLIEEEIERAYLDPDKDEHQIQICNAELMLE